MFFRALYRDLSSAVHSDQEEENCSREEIPPLLLSLMSSSAVDTRCFSGKPLPETPCTVESKALGSEVKFNDKYCAHVDTCPQLSRLCLDVSNENIPS